jgi:hypothetical protein
MAQKARKPIHFFTMTMQELDDLFRKCVPQEARRLRIPVAESDRR